MWTSQVDGGRYQLDYILIQNRCNNCMRNRKAYLRGNINADHNFVKSYETPSPTSDILKFTVDFADF